MKQAVLCMCLLAVAACSRKDTDETVTSTTEVTSVRLQPATRATVASFLDDDSALTRRVEATIASDPQLSMATRNVNVSNEGNAVTVRGFVPDWTTRDAVDEIVSRVAGERHVFNELNVDPVRDPDQRESDENIAFSLQRSLADEELVTIEVVRGIVTLRGRADDLDRIEHVAEHTPGVATVVNELIPDEVPAAETRALVQ